MPKISAVMALYNTPYSYLKTTVESLLNQSFKDFELIVIDDASSMQYKEFFEKFNDDRIKYFKLEKNAGPGHARNVGIKKAIGEYIAITDSDDVYMPRRFENQSKFLDENPDISLMGGTFRFSNKKRLSFVPIEDKDIRMFMLFNSPLNNSTIMFRREEFIQRNLFYTEDINFAEDYELWIDAMFTGIKMANLKEFLMIYTRRPGQLSKAKKEKQIAILKKLYKKIFSNLNLNFSQTEIDLHYNIECSNFNAIKSPEEISNWIDKIIEHNKNLQIFDKQTLIDKKNHILEDFYKFKNRVFKLKIAEYNFCIYKPFQITFERRS